jgi:hypothetical protein
MSIIGRSYRSEKREYPVYCGKLKVIISFKGDESFHFLLASLDNFDNQCACAYSESLVNTLTFALRRRFKIDNGGAEESEVEAIIKGIEYQRCSKGIESCPNAIAQALKDVFKEELPKK